MVAGRRIFLFQFDVLSGNDAVHAHVCVSGALEQPSVDVARRALRGLGYPDAGVPSSVRCLMSAQAHVLPLERQLIDAAIARPSGLAIFLRPGLCVTQSKDSINRSTVT